MGHRSATSQDFDVHTLRVVRALSDHGSLTATAKALGYSQPAISQLLTRLEKRLGMAVIERVGRRTRLTPAGLVLERHSHRILATMNTAAGELQELQGLRTGRVRLTAFPSASASIVPRLLSELAGIYPDVDITYHEAEPPEAVAAIQENHTDVAITFSHPSSVNSAHRESTTGLQVVDLFRDELRIVMPSEHGLVGHDLVQFSDFKRDKWIGGCPRCRLRLLELCEAEGFTPHLLYETDSATAVLSLVASGAGVAMLSDLAIGPLGLPLDGVSVRSTQAPNYRMIHAVTAIGAHRIPAVNAILKTLGNISLAWNESGEP